MAANDLRTSALNWLTGEELDEGRSLALTPTRKDGYLVQSMISYTADRIALFSISTFSGNYLLPSTRT